MSRLDDISTRGTEIRERLRQLLIGRQYPGDLKPRLLAAYVDVALEHHEAIWRLRESKLTGSALALVRSVFFDAMVRGWWINKVATTEQIEQASRDELKFPQMHQLLDEVKEAYFGALTESDRELAELVDRFFYWFKPLWKVLSSYTHSGGRQLARRFTGDQMKPSYTELEITQALNLSTMALLLLMLMFFASMGRHDEALKTRTLLMNYFAEFNGRLQSGQ
jgi:hypothetical protein